MFVVYTLELKSSLYIIYSQSENYKVWYAKIQIAIGVAYFHCMIIIDNLKLNFSNLHIVNFH